MQQIQLSKPHLLPCWWWGHTCVQAPSWTLLCAKLKSVGRFYVEKQSVTKKVTTILFTQLSAMELKNQSQCIFPYVKNILALVIIFTCLFLITHFRQQRFSYLSPTRSTPGVICLMFAVNQTTCRCLWSWFLFHTQASFGGMVSILRK